MPCERPRFKQQLLGAIMKSEKYPVSLPHYISEPLKMQMKEGILEFPTMADAIRGTLLCQLLKGGCHPVSEKLAMMSKTVQDLGR